MRNGSKYGLIELLRNGKPRADEKANTMVPILILALLAGSPSTRAGPSAAAAIEGTTTTDGAAPLPGVNIKIDNLVRLQHFETRSNTAGRYVIENVPPGTYTVLADAKGFGCVVIPAVVMQSGKRVKQDFEFLHSRKKLGCEAIPTKRRVGT